MTEDITGRSWTCPYCNRPQIITKGQHYQAIERLFLGSHKYGEAALVVAATACANNECREIALSVHFVNGELKPTNAGIKLTNLKLLEGYTLRPAYSSKPQPDYIPEPLRADYLEACKIRDLSPKASATLSRRCLQGMIRDFCKISKPTLYAEIAELSKQAHAGAAPKAVEHETVEAIDHVRSIGNIGAHMQKDIDVIVDVDAGEAQALIELTELLFDEWYVARHKRNERLMKVKDIKVLKDGEINAANKAKEAPSSDDEPTDTGR